MCFGVSSSLGTYVILQTTQYTRTRGIYKESRKDSQCNPVGLVVRGWYIYRRMRMVAPVSGLFCGYHPIFEWYKLRIFMPSHFPQLHNTNMNSICSTGYKMIYGWPQIYSWSHHDLGLLEGHFGISKFAESLEVVQNLETNARVACQFMLSDTGPGWRVTQRQRRGHSLPSTPHCNFYTSYSCQHNSICRSSWKLKDMHDCQRTRQLLRLMIFLALALELAVPVHLTW